MITDPETEVWRLGDAALARGFADRAVTIRRLQAEQLAVLAEVEQRGLAGATSTGLRQWVLYHDPVTDPAEASRLAKRAVALARPEVAATRAAVEAGTITARQADVVVAAVDDLADADAGPAEAFLLDFAAGARVDGKPVRPLDALTLRQVAAQLVARLDPGADDRLARDEHAQAERRELHATPLASGMVKVDGLLTTTTGHALIALLDAHARPLPASSATGAFRPDPRTAAQRRHDALDHLVTSGLLQSGTRHGSPVRLVVTVPARRMTGARTAAPATLPDGTPVSDSLLAELACDADLVPVTVDVHGAPLDVGATERLFTPRQRTALAVRDRHCTWSGCTAEPTWCHAHHLVPWQHGGPTDLANAALLCSAHHHHVHRLGLTGRLHDGSVHWDAQAPPGLSHAHATAHHALDTLVTRLRRRAC